ncbi:hypothetical protein C7B79_17250 [Chroococcidiopsis cubana CCALA 043]|nr:hypothetical protein C7B79_17250 [Chroococcidiopsis cubana CCALA 043]
MQIHNRSCHQYFLVLLLYRLFIAIAYLSVIFLICDRYNYRNTYNIADSKWFIISTVMAVICHFSFIRTSKRVKPLNLI